MKFVVTAGPTREPIDPVRFISNRSSGKMGYAIAEAALALGHRVTLISGPTALVAPTDVEFISIGSSDELHAAVHHTVSNSDVLVMCAAVSDYKPEQVSAQNLQKHREPFTIKLVPTHDILASLPRPPRNFLVVGFAAETHDLEIKAQKKLVTKGCDLIVANDVSKSDVGMESDENEVIVFFRNGESKKISRASKKIIAHELVKIISKMLEKRLTKKS